MAIQNQNYYEILGINQSATADEVRRAYRILARRYHPDLNPGKSSEERFKQIALAYQVLNDPDRRRSHDSEVESAKKIRAGFAAYERAQRQEFFKGPGYRTEGKSHQQTKRTYKAGTSKPKIEPSQSQFNFLREGLTKLGSLISKQRQNQGPKIAAGEPDSKKEVKTKHVSVVEMSVTSKEAIFGTKKSIEVSIGEQKKKISVRVPTGVKNGSILRISSSEQEEFILIIKVAPHPILELSSKGLIINLPINISEALFGASIKAPGLDGEEVVSIPAGSQSGDEVRLIQKGIKFESGQRGDLFYLLLIQIPGSQQAVGIKEKIDSLSQYYESDLRASLPLKISEI
jgi:curved DNA-binding protein